MKNGETTYKMKKVGTRKGDRLNWTPLKEVKRVCLRACRCSGIRLSQEELAKINHGQTSILIP